MHTSPFRRPSVRELRPILARVGPALGAVAVACLALQASVDLPVARWSQGLEGSPLFALARVLTVTGNAALPLVLTGLGTLAYALGPRYRRLARWSLFFFLCVALSGMSADVVKCVVARARPTLYFSQGIYGYHGFRIGHDWNSFPSGHAATLGALAAALAVLAPRTRIPVLILGALLAATRFLIHEHYVSDVVMGFAWGTASVALLRPWFEVRTDGGNPAPVRESGESRVA
jgi:membrane-associated phospholipid phosphatase